MAIFMRIDYGPVLVNNQETCQDAVLPENALIDVRASGRVTLLVNNRTGPVVATVVGSSPSITTYSPPVSNLLLYYYNNSYRYRLDTGAGDVIIRG
jgi:hypothetical protein